VPGDVLLDGRVLVQQRVRPHLVGLLRRARAPEVARVQVQLHRRQRAIDRCKLRAQLGRGVRHALPVFYTAAAARACARELRGLCFVYVY